MPLPVAGFTATGLDDIAAEAGITRVILYRHFDSKTELYQAVLDRMCGRLDAHVEELNCAIGTVRLAAAARARAGTGMRGQSSPALEPVTRKAWSAQLATDAAGNPAPPARMLRL